MQKVASSQKSGGTTTYEDYVLIAREHFDEGQYAQALDHYQKALNLCSGYRDKAAMAKILCSMGDTYKLTGDYNAAILYYKKSISVFDELRDFTSKGVTLSNLALLYGDIGNSKKAMEYLHQALQFVGDSHHKPLMATLNFRLGCGYLLEKRFIDARAYTMAALKIFRDLQEITSLINCMVLMAKVENGLGNDANTRELLHESIKLSANNGDDSFRQMHTYNVASEFIKMKEYFLAKQYLQKSLELAQQLNYWPGEILVQKAFVDIYAESEDCAQAVAQQRKIIDLYEERISAVDPTFRLPNTFQV